MRIVECQESSSVLGKLLYGHSGLWAHLLFLAWQFALFNKNATKWKKQSVSGDPGTKPLMNLLSNKIEVKK